MREFLSSIAVSYNTKRVIAATSVLILKMIRNVEQRMTLNCEIQRSVYVSVTTQKNAVLDFILTRKLVSKFPQF
jgi:hypothetical protein